MYAYQSSNRQAYLNLKEAATPFWMGLTAFIQNQPHLVIGKEGEKYVLENENGTIFRTAHFEWQPGTETSKLVAASRDNESPLRRGAKFDEVFIGRLAYMEDEWHVVTEDETAIVPIEDFVERLADSNWLKQAQDTTLLWLLQKDGSVIFAPWNEVSSHPGLIYKTYGSAAMADPKLDLYDPESNFAAMGEIRDGQVHLSAVLPPRIDTSPSQWEAIKIGRQVRQNLKQEGINTSMTMTASIPGQGDVEIPMYTAEKLRQVDPVSPTVQSSLAGEFVLDGTGEIVSFSEVQHFGSDKEVGAEEYWEVQGNDGNVYFITEDGSVRDQDDDVVGHFEAYAKQADFEDEHLAPQLNEGGGTEQTIQMQLPPSGIHIGTENQLRAAGLQCTLTYPPNSAFPEGLTASLPGELDKHMAWLFAHWDENGGVKPMDDVAVQLTAQDPQACEQAIYAADKRGGRQMASAYEAAITHEPKRCPNCGSHTYRQDATSKDGKFDVHCLTCGQAWKVEQKESMLKGSPYPSDSYKNSPDHTPKGQKKWPAEVNAVYNACMREGKGDKEKCAKIAWSQYDKTQKKDSATKHEPGTRVEVTHPSNSGQKGSILKHRGTDSGVGEDTYDILLDNGEKAEGLRASDIKRIKSASLADGQFLDSLPMLPQPGEYGSKIAWDFDHIEDMARMQREDGRDWDVPQESDEWTCPECEGQDFDINRGQAYCKNCGTQIAVEDLKHPDNRTGYGDDYTPGQLRGQETYYSAKEAAPYGAPQQTVQPAQTVQAPTPNNYQTQVPGQDPCPSCGSTNVMLASFDPSVGQPMYRCNQCGTIFSGKPQQQQSKVAFTDRDGNPLNAGDWYVMRSQNWKVPDVIQVLNLEENRIEAAIEGDVKGTFPLHIPYDDIEKEGYSFEPYKHEIPGLPAPTSADDRRDDITRQITDLLNRKRAGDPTVDEPELQALMKQYFAITDATENAQQEQQQVQPTQLPVPPNSQPGQMLSGWHIESRKNFTLSQQRDLINENPDGEARNFNKLDLSGTHYELQDKEEKDSLSDYFLWL